MGELKLPNEATNDAQVVSRSLGLVDFVLARAAAQKLSVREIAVLCGVKRGRCHNILHQNPDKRHPFRINEIESILIAVKVDQIEASLATEMLSRGPRIGEDDVHRVVSLLSEFMRGLPARIVDIVEHIEGLEFEDLKKEHGRWLQVAVCDILHDQFTDFVRRRDFRLSRARD